MTQTLLSISPSRWMKYHLIEAKGSNLPPSDLFSSKQGLFSGIEQAAKASYCSLLTPSLSILLQHSWGVGGPLATFQPPTAACSPPEKWLWSQGDGPMQWHLERPAAKEQNWEEGILAGMRMVEKTTGRTIAMRDMVGNGREVRLMQKE